MIAPEQRRLFSTVVMFLAVFLYGLWQLKFSSRYPQGSDTPGMDGFYYSSFARNPDPELMTKNSRGKRIVPSLIVRGALSLLGVEKSASNVVSAFEWLNLASLSAGVLFYCAIASALQLPLEITWFGFLATYGNFCFLRHIFYLPVLTDATAFFISMASLWAYVISKRAVLFALTLIGAFTWPATIFTNALFLTFPFRELILTPAEPESKDKIRWLPALVVALCLPIMIYARYFFGEYRAAPMSPTMSLLRPLGIFIACLYLYLGTKALTMFPLRSLFDRRLLRNLALPIAAFAIVLIVERLAGLARPTDTSTRLWRLLPNGEFLPLLVLRSTERPAGFLLAHVSFFGPAMLFLFSFWSRVAAKARELSLGIIAVLGFYLILTLNSETRHLIDGLPTIILLLCLLLRDCISARQVVLFGLVTLLHSRFWLPINAGEKYGYDFYFMNIGLFMTDRDYLTHLILFVGLFTIFLPTIRTLCGVKLPAKGAD